MGDEMEVLSGIRVVDVTAYSFCPAAGAVLAHWGADVVKVEPAHSPEAGRRVAERVPDLADDSEDLRYWHYNRGKRGIGLDLTRDEGRAILYRLVERADVFLTSYLTSTRQKLGIDLDDVRRHNERIIYAKGTGLGPLGPQADRGGFDLATWWGRGSLADSASRAAGTEFPPGMTGHGDGMAGLTLAGGICAALVQRERTGKASVVDGSLLGTAVWFNGIAINATLQGRSGWGQDYVPRSQKNPLLNHYRSKDGRYIQLCMHADPDRDWPDLLDRLGRPELGNDLRFADTVSRLEHRAEAVALLDELIGQHTYEQLHELLATTKGVWEPVQTPAELLEDPQVVANGFVRGARHADGRQTHLPTPGILFDGDSGEPRPGPGWGEHTDEVLGELGLTAAEVAHLREDRIVK
jgi:crotonobetainyl-CoA:carnitine CoA-transferase CaiB-like acyl-CoA transferase